MAMCITEGSRILHPRSIGQRWQVLLTMEYIFESENFGLSEDSFHLLRSRFNYKTYKNDEVRQLVVERGRLVNNWFVILTLGIVLIGFSLYYAYRLYYLLESGQISRIYIEEIVIPVIPFFMGIYSLYASLRIGPTLKVSFSDNKGKTFPLDKEQKHKNLDLLILTLKDSVGLKNKTTIKI